MIMRKIISIIVIIAMLGAMLFVLTGCGDKDTSIENLTNNSQDNNRNNNNSVMRKWRNNIL